MDKEKIQGQQQNDKIDSLLGYLKGIDPSVAQRATGITSEAFTDQPPPDPFTDQPPLGG